MTAFTYFAYGSNMLSARLRARCPSARPVDTARASAYRVAFYKRGHDDSGKATLLPDKAGHAMGVIYEIDDRDLPALDEAEVAGRGYDRIDDFAVNRTADTQPLAAVTYIAQDWAVADCLSPNDWYLALVLAGAQEHDLPSDYIKALCNTATLAGDPGCVERQQGLEALRRAGITDIDSLLRAPSI